MKGLDGIVGKRISDEMVTESYKRTGNVHKTGLELGLNHATVHERLVRLGIERNNHRFSREERDRLSREYAVFRSAGQLDQLAAAMKRNKSFLCGIARTMGLTHRAGPKIWAGKWKYMTEECAAILFKKFQHSRLGAGQFCSRNHLDDLGFSRTMQRFFPDEWDAVIEAKAPRQTMYRIGRAFEYRVRDDLKKIGYFVLRSPRSGSPVDLVAIRPKVVLLIQCKRGGQLGVEDWNELYDLAQSTGAIPLLAETAKGRGPTYWRLLDWKDGTKRAQPMGAFVPEHA